MARGRNPNRDKAFELYKENEGKISPKEIADILQEKIENIYTWKSIDKWNSNIEKKVGAPIGNNNASGSGAPVGNRNAKKEKEKKVGAPKGNLNRLKHGLYCDETKRLPPEFIKKYFPTGLKNAYEDTINLEISDIDKLKHSIDFLWNMILVTPKITTVKNKNDMTKELKREKESCGDKSSSNEKEYEIQFAWDKQNSSLDTYSKSIERLGNLIEKYEKLVHANWDLATEEQKCRVERYKLQVLNLEQEYKKNKLDKNKNCNPYADLTSDELRKMISDG